MDTKLKHERDLKAMPNRHLRKYVTYNSAGFREEQIKRLQAEHGYGRDDAAKLYEYQQFLATKMFMQSLVGGFAAHRVIPFQTEAAKHHPLFRKSWMKFPMMATAFAGAYYVAGQFTTRFFPKLSRNFYRPAEDRPGIRPESYQTNHDLISRFRMFDGQTAAADAKQSVEDYLDLYQSGPLTKAELLNRIADGLPVDPAFAKKFKIKRQGKDKDDLFWSFGKIHGLENIALVDDEKLKAAAGDPMALQKLVNEANDAPKPAMPGSYEDLLESIYNGLSSYEAAVENLGGKKEMNPSDKKKLLALPFYLTKRSALPEPKYGQKEWTLFEEMYGKPWNSYDGVKFDPEEKITEFNYEYFIPKHLLKTIDTQSDEFKQSIRMANFQSKTAMEQHKANQEEFQKLMPIFSMLDEEECEIFIHLLKSKQRKTVGPKQLQENMIDSDCDNRLAAELAKISEQENFALKNRYKHQQDTMKYADSAKMPIDAHKVKDLLRFQNVFRNRIHDELQTYDEIDGHTMQLQKGILTYVNEASWGDLKELLKDVGINRQSIHFNNVADMMKANDNILLDSDKEWKAFTNARYLQVDMTDYEENFPGYNEVGPIAFNNINNVKLPEKWPAIHTLVEINELENPLPNVTGRTHRESFEARSAEEEEEEEEEDEDEDEDEEDEEGGDEEEDDEEEEDEEEEENPFPDDVAKQATPEDRFFRANETLYGKYNEVELDAFMKLLNIKPKVQWQDETTHHYKVGSHVYEDESQEVDPYFHLLAEVERKHMERQQAMEFRRGTEVRFSLDPKKKPVFSGY